MNVPQANAGEIYVDAKPKRTDMPSTAWKRDETVATHEVYFLGEPYNSREYGYVGQYAGSNRFNWQAIRGDFRIGGIEEGAAAAMACCEATLALPMEEYNARVADELLRDLSEIEKKLMRIRPSVLMPGWSAGFDAGYENARNLIINALGAD